jgi:hypothetical protein
MPACSSFPGPLPAGLVQLSSGIVTPARGADMVGTGGQACYVELKNNTLHATPLTLRFYDTGPDGRRDRCASTFLMTPGFGSTLYFRDTVLGAKLTWRCEVSVSADVDVAHVLCRMLSLPPQ